MRKMFIAGFIIVIATVSYAANENKFQLVPGYFVENTNDSRGNSHSEKVPGIFKIDSVTGKTWIFLYILDIKNNESTLQWISIKD